MAQLQIKDVCKDFGDKEVLKDISFNLEDGKMLGLVGPSGCGKSTTLKVIAGLINPESGTVWIDGENITQVPMEERNTVVVFQDFLLFPHMTVVENIGFGLRIKKENRRLIKQCVNELIRLVHLEGSERKYPHELSGGQKQRVAIARALAIKPKVLLLDEPFSSLDMRLREEMRSFIKEIHDQTDTTMILVTHDKEEAFELCDMIGIMMNGNLMQVGEPREVYEKPNTKAVAEFFGPVYEISGTVKDGQIRTQFSEVVNKTLPDGQYKWMIRPEHITLEKEGIEAEVISSKFLGAHVLYTIRIKGEELLMQTSTRIHLQAKEKIKVHIHLECALKVK